MPYPTLEELRTAVSGYVDKTSSPEFATAATDEAVVMAGQKLDPAANPDLYTGLDEYIADVFDGVVPGVIFKRGIQELAAELFYKRQVKNGIVTINAMDGAIARGRVDSWGAVEHIFRPYMSPAIA